MYNSELNYHFHPKNGWLNDPNGLVFFKGYYHFFFQHSPHFENPGKEPIVWGHARTKDFLHFEELSPALLADQTYDEGGVWSGTAKVIDDTLYLFYASLDREMKQTISVAYSFDGETFHKFEENPVISDYPKDGSRDFRDPAIFRKDNVNYLVIASADVSKKTGNLLLYKSDDLKGWEYQGVLYECADARFCECPSLVPYGDGAILSTSVVLLNDEHFFEVLYGTFDGKTFEKKIVSRFQRGPDEYAGQIFSAPDGRTIMVSWVSGWKYAGEERCIGCLSLPLELTVEGDKIKAYPVEEVRNLLDEHDTFVDAYVKESFIKKGEEVHIELIR